MKKSLLMKKVAECVMLEDLYDGLDKFVGKNTICSVINGFSGVVFLDNFNYGADVNKLDERYLTFDGEDKDTGMECTYTVQLDEIKKVEKDIFINQLFLSLKNGQVLQLWTDIQDEYAEHNEN